MGWPRDSGEPNESSEYQASNADKYAAMDLVNAQRRL